jgi:hypothetical protein
MGRRGPPPQSPSVARLHGTFRPYRHGNRPEPPELPPLGNPPDWVIETEGLLAIWRDVTDHAAHLRAADQRQVQTLVFAIYLHDRDRVRLLEYATEPPPALLTRVRAGAKLIMALSKELGLTPIARQRLVMEGTKGVEKADPDDSWERLRNFSLVRRGDKGSA